MIGNRGSIFIPGSRQRDEMNPKAMAERREALKRELAAIKAKENKQREAFEREEWRKAWRALDEAPR